MGEYRHTLPENKTMTIKERIESLIEKGADIRMTSARRGYSSHLPTGECAVITNALLDQIEASLSQDSNGNGKAPEPTPEPIKPKEEPKTEKPVAAKAVIANIIPKAPTETVQLSDTKPKAKPDKSESYSHLDNLGEEDDEINLDDFESEDSGEEYGEAPQIPDKPHWTTLTEGIETSHPVDSLEYGLERILLTAVAMNPRQSSFDLMDKFQWEPGHYRVLFPGFHRLLNTYDLALPYMENEAGEPIVYMDRDTGTWVNRSKYDFHAKAHLLVYGPTGVGKSDLHDLFSRFVPVTDTPMTNFQSVAAFKRSIGNHFTVSASNPSLRISATEVLEAQNPDSDNPKDKEHFKVIGLGSHPSLVQRKTKDKNKGYPKRLCLSGYLSLGDLNRKGGSFSEEVIQNALKMAGFQRIEAWRPHAGSALPLGNNCFYMEIALEKLGVIAKYSIEEAFRRTMAIPANPAYGYKKDWQPTLLHSLDFDKADDFFRRYTAAKVRVVPSKRKFPLECHRAQFTRVKGENRYPLAEKVLTVRDSGFLTGCLSDSEWHTLFLGTEYESNAKNSLTQFFTSLAAFILLEFPTLFSGQLSDEDIAAEIRDTDPKAIHEYRKQFSSDVLRSMFREYYVDFSEMLRSVVREHNAISNGAENLKIWISQRINWLTTHDQLNRPIAESGEKPLIFDKARLPGELLSQSSTSPFSLYYQARSGSACKPGILPNGKPDPERRGLVYNGNNASLSKDFTLAVSALGYVADQESGCWILDSQKE